MPRTFLSVTAHLKNFRIFIPGIIPAVSIAFSMKIANELTRAILFVPHTATPCPVVWPCAQSIDFFPPPPPPYNFQLYLVMTGTGLKLKRYQSANVLLGTGLIESDVLQTFRVKIILQFKNRGTTCAIPVPRVSVLTGAG